MQASPEAPASVAAVDIADARQRLQKLLALHASGGIGQADFDTEKAQLEQQILNWALQEPAVRVEKSTLGLFAVLAVFVAIVAIGGYALSRRSPARPESEMAGTLPPTTSQSASEAAPTGAQPHATTPDQIGSMVDKLAARLKANPDDAAGWSMLARSYAVMGRSADAADAYGKAVKLSGNDAGLLVDYADALAVQNNRSLTGEPMKLIEQALKIDPRNVKGLAIAGTDAFERKDYRKAVQLWQSMAEIAGDDNMFVVQIQPRLTEARQLAGMPAKAPTAAASVSAPVGVGVAAAANRGVRGVVTLSAKLAKDASPEDTLFIFARPANGSRMPLAILRKKVKDLPVQFALDDSQSMSADAKLSRADSVIVGARISKSGQALPTKGDFSGQSKPVPIGTSDLAIEINDVVTQQ